MNHFSQSVIEERIVHIMKMKKTTVTVIVSSLLLVGGVTALFATTPVGAAVSQPSVVQTSADANHIYRAGEIWKVDGEWEFTINSVHPTAARAAKGDYDIKARQVNQVLVMDYNYRNTGFDDSQKGAGIGLSFSKANFDVSNQRSENGDATYPVQIPGMDEPVGGLGDHMWQHAVWTYAFSEKSDTVTVHVAHYDSDLKLHEATFIVPVAQK
ncbi:hypothetical protein [Paenibacillus wulumuqiensis]|uniref:hypothetical protein n=1 Tax=Paenibacillus wulumuqiensis TaxID=1567107 RepID=UPI000696ECF5|nr:hypothetical protein [Paenibacillus wulumuqiensis]